MDPITITTTIDGRARSVTITPAGEGVALASFNRYLTERAILGELAEHHTEVRALVSRLREAAVTVSGQLAAVVVAADDTALFPDLPSLPNPEGERALLPELDALDDVATVCRQRLDDVGALWETVAQVVKEARAPAPTMN